MIRKLLEKAERSLATAKLDLEARDSDASVNRSYYAAFDAAWALFESTGIERPKKHSGLIGEFSRHFVKNGPLDSSLGVTSANAFVKAIGVHISKHELPCPPLPCRR